MADECGTAPRIFLRVAYRRLNRREIGKSVRKVAGSENDLEPAAIGKASDDDCSRDFLSKPLCLTHRRYFAFSHHGRRAGQVVTISMEEDHVVCRFLHGGFRKARTAKADPSVARCFCCWLLLCASNHDTACDSQRDDGGSTISEGHENRTVPGILIGFVGVLNPSTDVTEQMIGVVDIISGTKPETC